jgi:hypothetical protein
MKPGCQPLSAAEAAHPEYRSQPLEQANQALLEPRFGSMQGATVIRIKT